MDCSPPGSSVCGSSQARNLERVAISSSRGSSRPREQACSSYIAGGFFTTEPPGKPETPSVTLSSTSGHAPTLQVLAEVPAQGHLQLLGVGGCLAQVPAPPTPSSPLPTPTRSRPWLCPDFCRTPLQLPPVASRALSGEDATSQGVISEIIPPINLQPLNPDLGRC